MKICNICENKIIGEVCNVTINDLEYQEICSKCCTSIENKIIELKKTLTYQELDKLNNQFYQPIITAKYGIRPYKGTVVYGVNISNVTYDTTNICGDQESEDK